MPTVDCGDLLHRRWPRLDMAITECIEDQFDQLPGSGDGADVAASARRDPLPHRRKPGAFLGPLHRFDRGPADQPASLLGDPAAVHGGVGS